MNLLRRFRSTRPATLLVATALLLLVAPSYAKKGDPPEPADPEICDDMALGTMTMDGVLAVESTSELSACSTKIELRGSAVSNFQTASGKQLGKPKYDDIRITMILVETHDNEGVRKLMGGIVGTMELPDSSGKPETLDISGVVGPEGQIQFTVSSKKGLNAVNVRQAFTASVTGTVLFNPKEYSIKTKGYYVGHVSLLR